MNVYATRELCTHQTVWLDDGYDAAGHHVYSGSEDPVHPDHYRSSQGERHEIIGQCQIALATSDARCSHLRTIARLTLHALGESTNV